MASNGSHTPMNAELAPLSHAQHRVLLTEHSSPGNAENMVIFGHLLTGSPSPDELRAGLRDVVSRHSILRTTYGWLDGCPVQRTLDLAACEPQVEFLPKTTVESPQEMAHLAAASTADWWGSRFELANPPMRVRYLPLAERGLGGLLFIGLHHIACDGWSVPVFSADLATACSARRVGQPPGWSAVPSYQSYAFWEQSQVDSWLSADLPFWRETLSREVGQALPSAPSRHEAPMGECGALLDASTVGALLMQGRRLGGLPLSLLLSASAEAIGRQTGAARIAMSTVLSGRLEARFRSVMGCFVNPIPIPVTRPRGGDLAGQLTANTRTMLRCLRHSRTPVDELTRVLRAEIAQARWFDLMVIFDDSVPARSGTDARGVGVRTRGLPTAPLPVSVRRPRTSTTVTLQTFRQHDGSWLLQGRWRRDTVSDEFGQQFMADIVSFLRNIWAGMAKC